MERPAAVTLALAVCAFVAGFLLQEGAAHMMLLVGGLVLLVTAYVLELAGGRSKTAALVKASDRAPETCQGTFVVSSGGGGIKIVDNWEAKGGVSLRCPSGTYIYEVERAWSNGECSALSILIRGKNLPSRSPARSTCSIAVDTGFIIFADADFVSEWNEEDIEEAILNMMEKSETGRASTDLLSEGVVRGVAVIPLLENGIYGIEHTAHEKVPFELSANFRDTVL